MNILNGERILSPVDDLGHRWVQPIEVGREVCVVGEVPVEGVVKEIDVGVDVGVLHDCGGDEASKRAGASRGVQTGLGDGGALRADDLKTLC